MIWIITQDKQSLMHVREVTVNGKKIEGSIGSGAVDEWGKVLGKYDSNDRALEVLNEIFLKIEASSHTNVTFTMPQK
ncbi:hypothetical protein [Bacillus massiliglaciei]|uniref:hypothetical protein n=1 Tax=Bacillus massiliglaciei TaxID=1816693 RepID=UPI000DA605A7|nr:hypothetical protein [Bacillus massiliglaciei]